MLPFPPQKKKNPLFRAGREVSMYNINSHYTLTTSKSHNVLIPEPLNKWMYKMDRSWENATINPPHKGILSDGIYLNSVKEHIETVQGTLYNIVLYVNTGLSVIISITARCTCSVIHFIPIPEFWSFARDKSRTDSDRTQWFNITMIAKHNMCKKHRRTW